MPDSPLWLGLVGAVTGVGGLVWNGWSYRMQGARPKIQLIYGGVFEELGVIATTKRESLKQTLKGLNSASLNTDRLVAGLRVRNHGRAPLQVSGISWRTTDGDRGHNAHLLFEGSPSMPTEIAAAGEATFYVALDLLNKKIALSETWSERPQRICLEMWNSHGEYRSNNVPSEILALAPPEQS